MKLAGYIASIQEDIKAEKARIAILQMLGDVGEVESCYVSYYSKDVSVQPISTDSARALALRFVANIMKLSTTKDLVAAQKSFDASTGKVTYTVVGPMPDWKITIAGGDPRCKIKKVEEV